MRTEILLNNDWNFHKGDIKVETPYWKGPVYSQSKTERKKSGPAAYSYQDAPDQFYSKTGILTHEKWEKVNIPHDYIVDQDLSENENNSLGYLHYDNAWYRKRFCLPENSLGKRILLRFDGIAGSSVIYLNGCLMKHNFSRYNTFEIDITNNAYYDKENVLAVYVNTEEFEGWWYQGGGIYRDVHLTVTEPVAVDLWGVYAPYKKLDNNNWQIDFETTVVNSLYSDEEVRVESTVCDANGNAVAKGIGNGLVPLREKGVIKYSALAENPLLWDCDSPNLYTVETRVFCGGEPTDVCFTRIGFRTVEFTVDRGLLLNGKKTVIKGVCSHQDYGLTGLAVPRNVAEYKIGLLKEMGANGYRTSHYQQTEYYMDALDEMGFLVMDETRWFQTTEETNEQLEYLIKRDRNRPSVIMWSTGNEEPSHITQNGALTQRAMAAFIRKLDYTRPITAAEDKTPDRSTIYDYCDIIGINYNLDIYDKVHEMCPEKPVFSSECCATGTTRDWNYPPFGNMRLTDKDRETNSWFKGREDTWKFLMSRPYVFGAYQWIGVEHRGEAAWPAICSKSGALDLFLQKKGAFYQNKSLWTDKPMVHIVPHWNFEGQEGTPITVTVYTNCRESELILNGRSLGVKQIEKYGHGEWTVAYEKGELTAKGYIKGALAAEEVKRTSGKPDALRLTLENSFEANGSDLAIFTCECTDKDGNVVPDASEHVRFSVADPAVIVGTGSDNCDHNRVGATERHMYMGKISIAVKPAYKQEEIMLMAQSDNLKTAVFRRIISEA